MTQSDRHRKQRGRRIRFFADVTRARARVPAHGPAPPNVEALYKRQGTGRVARALVNNV
jgi:hypothetical protein